MSVHDAHCCKIHCCKYGHDNFPVYFGDEEGIECEECEYDHQEALPYLSKINELEVKLKMYADKFGDL